MQNKQQREEAAQAATETGADPAIMASAASVVLSWYYFFGRGEKEMGMFVGLWPPTILAFASYFEQTRMSDRLKQATSSGQGGVRESVQKMIGNQ